jgi:D-serine deaminase-like pyridoxal phosphate-dependent protein
VLAEAGVSDILVANETAEPLALDALASAARQASVMAAVDNMRHVELLAEVAARHGVTIGVLAELDGDRAAGFEGSDRLILVVEAVAARTGVPRIQAYEGTVEPGGPRTAPACLAGPSAGTTREGTA